MTSCRRAFTLFEILVVLTIIVTVVALVAPAMTDQRQVRLTAAIMLLRSDLEHAQVATLANPDDPVVIVFDTIRNSYQLERLGAPGVAIEKPGSSDPYVRTFGVGEAAGAEFVNMRVEDMPDNTLEFNGQGGLADFTLEPNIVLKCDATKIALSIAPTTGTVTEVAR